jgi:hypothetical protein
VGHGDCDQRVARVMVHPDERVGLERDGGRIADTAVLCRGGDSAAPNACRALQTAIAAVNLALTSCAGGDSDAGCLAGREGSGARVFNDKARLRGSWRWASAASAD